MHLFRKRFFEEKLLDYEHVKVHRIIQEIVKTPLKKTYVENSHSMWINLTIHH